MGIRYEYQDMTNRNFLGKIGQVLEDGDTDGFTIFDRTLQANTVSAFLQTDIKAAKNFHVVPGVRFEWYGVNRDTRVAAQEEGEAEGPEEPEPGAPQEEIDEYQEALEECSEVTGIPVGDEDELQENCRIIEGIDREPLQREVRQLQRAAGYLLRLQRLLPHDAVRRLSPRAVDGRAAQRGLPGARRDRRQLPDRLRVRPPSWASTSRSPLSTSA